MSGKADYKPVKGLEKRTHVIGPPGGPLFYTCLKEEVPGLITKEFLQYFKMWRYFNMGFGLPYNKQLVEQDPFLINILLEMEQMYRVYFSPEKVVKDYMEGMIKIFKVGFGLK